MSYLFLFREKDSDDRDCCAYIDSKNPRFECQTVKCLCCGEKLTDYID